MNEAAGWLDLSGKVAHVTGGARGIGAAIARALRMAGATVMLSDLDGDAAEATAKELDAWARKVVLEKSEAEERRAEWKPREGADGWPLRDVRDRWHPGLGHLHLHPVGGRPGTTLCRLSLSYAQKGVANTSPTGHRVSRPSRRNRVHRLGP